jgi:hypothetical protein
MGLGALTLHQIRIRPIAIPNVERYIVDDDVTVLHVERSLSVMCSVFHIDTMTF